MDKRGSDAMHKLNYTQMQRVTEALSLLIMGARTVPAAAIPVLAAKLLSGLDNRHRYNRGALDRDVS
jgi:hypothetical protein